VQIDGSVVGTFTPSGTNYSAYTTASFTVTAGLHTIRFVGLNPNGGDNTALIDFVHFDVSDGGFETPVVGSGFDAYAYRPTGSPWTFSGLSAGVAGNGSEYTFANPNAPQGSQVAFLEQYGTISQAINFAAGTYTLSFLAAQESPDAAQDSSQTFQVEIDGSVVGTPFTPADTNYQPLTTAPFTVTAGLHTISFVGLNPNDGDNTVFIDAVTVQLG
jgi:hypothetical protein